MAIAETVEAAAVAACMEASIDYHDVAGLWISIVESIDGGSSLERVVSAKLKNGGLILFKVYE